MGNKGEDDDIITSRQATAADYQAVLDLDPAHTIYSGNDYLPAEYFRFLNDPDRTLIVYLVNGKIVSLAMRHVVDEGQTIIGMAARTSTSARGQGVWRAFVADGFGKDSQMHKVDQFGGVTVTHWLWNAKTPMPGLTVPRLICKRILRYHEFKCAEVESIQNVYDSNHGQCTRIISPEESLRYLHDTHTQWQLFPSKRIVCDSGFVAYRLMTDNFRKIARNSLCITASTDIQNECKSLAFGDGRPVHTGYQYTVNYYGNDTSDVPNIIDHARVHLPIAVKHCTKEPVMFRVAVPNTVPEAELRKGLSMLKGHTKSSDNKHTLFIFERYNLKKQCKL